MKGVDGVSATSRGDATHGLGAPPWRTRQLEHGGRLRPVGELAELRVEPVGDETYEPPEAGSERLIRVPGREGHWMPCTWASGGSLKVVPLQGLSPVGGTGFEPV